ncbi:MAG: hypothetical protein PWP14_394 [Methanolobus sp.]|jgi:hypothetical protein|nr:hypothetical protein [Methanolobus sp.]
MDSGKIIYYNWNRISMLNQKAENSLSEKEEISSRIGFQNDFANEKTDTEAYRVAGIIEKTITPDIIKKVDHFRKEK